LCISSLQRLRKGVECYASYPNDCGSLRRRGRQVCKSYQQRTDLSPPSPDQLGPRSLKNPSRLNCWARRGIQNRDHSHAFRTTARLAGTNRRLEAVDHINAVAVVGANAWDTSCPAGRYGAPAAGEAEVAARRGTVLVVHVAGSAYRALPPPRMLVAPDSERTAMSKEAAPRASRTRDEFALARASPRETDRAGDRSRGPLPDLKRRSCAPDPEFGVTFDFRPVSAQSTALHFNLSPA
jgi:hypothetical protein